MKRFKPGRLYYPNADQEWFANVRCLANDNITRKIRMYNTDLVLCTNETHAENSNHPIFLHLSTGLRLSMPHYQIDRFVLADIKLSILESLVYGITMDIT